MYFQDLLEICGGDRTPGLVWPHLKTVYLSFNSLQELDQSLVSTDQSLVSINQSFDASFQLAGKLAMVKGF